jgi:hypothetical protein
MKMPRLSIRNLMILVAVVGLLLGWWMFRLKCEKNRKLIQHHMELLDYDIRELHMYLRSISDYLFKLRASKDIRVTDEQIARVAEEANLLRGIIMEYRDQRDEWKHLLRHPWLDIPMEKMRSVNLLERLGTNSPLHRGTPK